MRLSVKILVLTEFWILLGLVFLLVPSLELWQKYTFMLSWMIPATITGCHLMKKVMKKEDKI